MGPESGSAFAQGLSGALLVGLAGFLYLHSSYYQRFQHAAAGQQTKGSLSFAFGIGILLITSICMVLSKAFYPRVAEFLHETWMKVSPIPGLGTIFIIAPAIGLLLGLGENFSRLIINSNIDLLKDASHPLYTTNLRARMRLAALSDFAKVTEDRLFATLWRAITLGKLIQISLQSRKVYIGSPLSSGDPSVESRWLKIIPIASGYRDSEDLSYVPTTDYRALFDELATNGASKDDDLKQNSRAPLVVDLSDLGILICWSEIVSLTIYDPGLEDFFSGVNEPEKLGQLSA